MNFLQAHYNRFRQEGGSHGVYVAVNDLSDEMARELEAEYLKAYPEPVSEKKIEVFERLLKKEAEKARLKDDLEWLLGTGRYGQ